MSELLKAASLAIVLLAINAHLADWYRDRVMWYGIGERTFRQFEEHRADLDTLILGDSHPKWGLHPSEIGRAFNLALPGQRYAETYYTLEAQLDRDDLDIRIVLLQADLHSFAGRGLDQFALAHFYAPSVDYLEMGWRRGSPFTYTVHWLQARFAPYVGGRRNILRYLDSGKPADLKWLHSVDLEAGALVHSGSIDSETPGERVERAKRRTKLHFGDEEPFSAFPEHYFREILDLCYAHGIDVVVLQFPMTEEYLEAADEFIDRRAFDRRLKEMIAPYENVRLAETREIFSGRTGVFVDSDHLNERGAILFSRRIRNQFIQGLRRSRRTQTSRSAPAR